MYCTVKFVGTIAYVLVLIGSGGMIAFATQFGFSTNLDGYRLMETRFLGLNGAQVWIGSWVLVLLGTLGQLIVFRATLP